MVLITHYELNVFPDYEFEAFGEDAEKIYMESWEEAIAGTFILFRRFKMELHNNPVCRFICIEEAGFYEDAISTDSGTQFLLTLASERFAINFDIGRKPGHICI